MKSLKTSLLLTALLSLLVTDSSHSQISVPARRWYRPVATGVALGTGYGPYRYGYYGGGYYGGGTSAVGDARRGMADVIRAQGESAKSQAEAMKSYEEARSKYIDNKKKWTETYLERQRMGKASRQEYYDQKREARNNYLAQKQRNTPDRLSTDQIDSATGHISWPSALTDDRFQADREQLDELFVMRAHTNTTESLTQQILAAASDMQAKLKQNISDIPAYEYIDARKFLDGLIYEAQHSAG